MTRPDPFPAPAGVDLRAAAAALDQLGAYPLELLGRDLFRAAHRAIDDFGEHDPGVGRLIAGVYHALGVEAFDRRDRLRATGDLARDLRALEEADAGDLVDLLDDGEGALLVDDPVALAALAALGDDGDGGVDQADGSQFAVERIAEAGDVLPPDAEGGSPSAS